MAALYKIHTTDATRLSRRGVGGVNRVFGCHNPVSYSVGL